MAIALWFVCFKYWLLPNVSFYRNKYWIFKSLKMVKIFKTIPIPKKWNIQTEFRKNELKIAQIIRVNKMFWKNITIKSKIFKDSKGNIKLFIIRGLRYNWFLYNTNNFIKKCSYIFVNKPLVVHTMFRIYLYKI